MGNFIYCIIVCLAKILEISVQSVKTVFMVKGQRIQAALLGFLECVIWGLVISAIIDTLSGNPLMSLPGTIQFSGIIYDSSLHFKISYQ